MTWCLEPLIRRCAQWYDGTSEEFRIGHKAARVYETISILKAPACLASPKDGRRRGGFTARQDGCTFYRGQCVCVQL
jgi:hypothetical protein